MPELALSGTTMIRTWAGFFMMCVGMFMAILNVQVVATSLPAMQTIRPYSSGVGVRSTQALLIRLTLSCGSTKSNSDRQLRQVRYSPGYYSGPGGPALVKTSKPSCP